MLFVTGAWLYPIVHQQLCDEHHDSTHAADCAVCLIKQTPAISSTPVLEPVTPLSLPEVFTVPQSLSPCPCLPVSTLARGPPVA